MEHYENNEWENNIISSTTDEDFQQWLQNDRSETNEERNSEIRAADRSDGEWTRDEVPEPDEDSSYINDHRNSRCEIGSGFGRQNDLSYQIVSSSSSDCDATENNHEEASQPSEECDQLYQECDEERQYRDDGGYLQNEEMGSDKTNSSAGQSERREYTECSKEDVFYRHKILRIAVGNHKDQVENLEGITRLKLLKSLAGPDWSENDVQQAEVIKCYKDINASFSEISRKLDYIIGVSSR
jgi:hypothetical protein